MRSALSGWCWCWRSWGRDLRLGMLIRDTSIGLSGAGGMSYQTDADFFIAFVCSCCCGCGGAFSSCRRASVASVHEAAQPRTTAGRDVDDEDHWPSPPPLDGPWACSPQRNLSMSARNVFRRSGSSNGYVGGGGCGDDEELESATAVGSCWPLAAGVVGGECFTRNVHTSFMAHCRFCLFTKDSGLAVMPIGELSNDNYLH